MCVLGESIEIWGVANQMPPANSTATVARYTVLIVSDNPHTRAELSARLEEQDIDVLAELTPEDDLSEFTEGVEVILWEADDPPPSTVQELGVPLLALVKDFGEATRALQGGALGVVDRRTDVERLVSALEPLGRGLAVLEPAFLTTEQTEEPEEAGDFPLEPLTPREQGVLALLAEGLTNKAIAKRLDLSEHTVKFHLNAVLGKLGASTRTEAVTRALRAGLLTL